MFLESNSNAERVEVWFQGKPLQLAAGANLAAALLAEGVRVFRHSPVSGSPRAPFCMMGACYDCLVEIDGTVRQACMMTVEEGMRISRPHESDTVNATR